MNRHLLICLSLLLSLSASSASQTKEVKNAPNKNAAAAETAAKNLEAERLLKERRANAESLLVNLAVDARNFKDQTLRARTQARIAYALWDVDHERSRTMFRAAWEAAVIADREAGAKVQENARQQQAKTGSGGYVAASPPQVRREVLRLAAKRDRELGEEMLGKFKEQKEADAATERNKRRNPLGDSDEALRQRLELARQLLAAGDIDRAMKFAEPILNSVSAPTIDFLSYLREKNPTAADERYANMLASAGANPNSDANTVSLLSSYLFTPHHFVAFVSNGTYASASGPPGEQPNVEPALRLAFFRTASSILLRPPAPAGAESSSGNDGTYLVIKRLLPLFEQYAPQEMTTALTAQLTALASLASKDARERDDESVREGMGAHKPENSEQGLLDRLERARTPAERDELNLELAMAMADRGDLRARDYVSRIDDMEIRNSARAYIDASLTLRAIEKKDAERALEIMRKAELTHLQRSWGLAQSAKLLAKTDRDRALSLIEEAATEARRIQNSDADRPRALFGVLNTLALLDRKAAWTAADDAIQAANSAEGFTGEDGELTFQLITRDTRAINQSPAPEFNVAPVFELFAEEDYEKAVDLARQFQRDAVRATAIIAIAGTVLEEKKK